LILFARATASSITFDKRGPAIRECGKEMASSCRGGVMADICSRLRGAGLRANATCSIGGSARSASMVDINCSATVQSGGCGRGIFTSVIQSVIPLRIE